MTNTINNFPLYASLLTTDYLAAWQGSQSPSTRKVPVSALATYYAALASANTFTGKITVSSGGIAITGNSTITGTLGGLTGLTVASGGATISGNTKITGTLESTSTLTVDAGGLTITTGGMNVTGASTLTGTLGGLTGLTVASGGATITGNSTITGTLGGLTGLTVASGGAKVTGNSTITGTLTGLTGLTVASGGMNVTGNSTLTGTLGGLTGLTVASGGAAVTGNSSITGALTISTNGTSGNQAVNFSQFDQTQSGTGHVAFPGGMFLQWGTAPQNGTGTMAVSFTPPFAGAVYSIVATAISSSAGADPVNVEGASKTGFTVHCAHNNVDVYWMAMGL